MAPRFSVLVLASAALMTTLGCTSYMMRHAIQGDSRGQILQADLSQVKVRAAQSRAFDTKDRLRMLEGIVATLQDLDFQVMVLDEELGIVSGQKFLGIERSETVEDPYYTLYDDESLVPFTRVYRTWGPFWHRSDLVRLTITVRKRNAEQLIVRASAQFYLAPVEEPKPYRDFFQHLSATLANLPPSKQTASTAHPHPSPR